MSSPSFSILLDAPANNGRSRDRPSEPEVDDFLKPAGSGELQVNRLISSWLVFDRNTGKRSKEILPSGFG